MSVGTCAMCGAVGPVDRHHTTGRAAPAASYCDPALTIAVCPRCHADLHVARRVVGAEWGDQPGIRVSRLVADLAPIADAGRPVVLDAGGLRGLLLDVLSGDDRGAA